jgi:hypothetical protein
MSFSDKLQQLARLLRWMSRNARTLRALREMEQMRAALVRANVELGKLSPTDEMYVRRLAEFDQATIESTKGKWNTARAMETGSKEDWARAFLHIRRGKELGEQVHDALLSQTRAAVPHEEATLSSNGTEILFADGVPLVPSINPIVILAGSDHDMGYQYAQQVIQIFGAWILERKAGRRFTQEERGVMSKWEEQIRQHAPEILGMCEGWAAGATDAGVRMSYEDVLELWTDRLPPATTYLGRGEGTPQIGPPLCSGAAAWGRATSDGRLVTGSSGDHDPTYAVTIVAFPETGNNYIITPFSATGDVPILGTVGMMGHPGMNSAGVAYVEHGGEPRMIEPRELWGYGIRKGTAIFHILRFANSAREALEMELSYPIGDAGRPLGSVGGFYADSTYGYVLESRKDPTIVREAGVMGETDFLYANNNAIHPGAGEAGWMQRNRESWNWDPHGGWYPLQPTVPDILSATRGSPERRTAAAMNLIYNNSRWRNVYLFDMLDRAVGRINLETMKMMYRRSGALPPGSWDEITAVYKARGQWGEISAGHAGNALVAVTKPHDGDAGIYALCASTAARGLTPNTPNPSGGPIHGETNAFWELRLASHPAGVAAHAKLRAREFIAQARRDVAALQGSTPAHERLQGLLEIALSEFTRGEGYEDSAERLAGADSIYDWARATRAFTRAQVRALQVHQALVPPPSRPEDLGL